MGRIRLNRLKQAAKNVTVYGQQSIILRAGITICPDIIIEKDGKTSSLIPTGKTWIVVNHQPMIFVRCMCIMSNGMLKKQYCYTRQILVLSTKRIFLFLNCWRERGFRWKHCRKDFRMVL